MAVPLRARRAGRSVGVVVGAVIALIVLPATAPAQAPTTDDPRVGLSAGLENAGTAALGMTLDGHANKPPGWFDPANAGSFSFVNSDLAFQDQYAFVGGFNGIQIFDVSNPSAPVLKTGIVCPGGQGDVSVHGNLLFMSVEQASAKTDCSGPTSTTGTKFIGVRIFDISDIAAPVQVATVQTCRGSHTHTLVTDKDDPANVYIYVQGTGGVRPASELAGCYEDGTAVEPASRWRIDVIKVPVAAPQNAAVVGGPRLFKNESTGAINGLQNTPPTPLHPSGMNWGPTPTTDSCHDITVYPALDIAAGACEGNGLLIDISDPANPERIDAAQDNNYAYWHGATFSNDGKTVVFTDEWGGGTTARCRAAAPPNRPVADDLKWGANAIYDVVDGKLQFRSYFKIPPVQTTTENCVSHIPSLVPVPGRDIMVQAWYQGGASLIDFSDSSAPKEIGYFDRGPISATGLVLGGLWSTYWYNGQAYGSEIARGLDVFGLQPTADLSANEIAAAKEVQVDRLNVQHQDPITWAPSFNVTRAFIDQAVRSGDLSGDLLTEVNKFVDRAERFRSGPQAPAAKASLKALANELPGEQFDDLRGALIALSEA